MKLPIGMLVYWANRFDDSHSVIVGLWYYKEIYVPNSIEEKKQSVLDLKEKRCTLITVHGKYDQILDLLMQSAHLERDGVLYVSKYKKFEKQLSDTGNKAYLFDDVYNVKGTSLTLDILVDVDNSFEDIMSTIKKGKGVDVFISENWSFYDDLKKVFDDL